jgi:hypothetical protein
MKPQARGILDRGRDGLPSLPKSPAPHEPPPLRLPNEVCCQFALEIALPRKGAPPAGYDTSLAWDPVHKVVVLINEMGFGAETTTFLLRYDDKQVKGK